MTQNRCIGMSDSRYRLQPKPHLLARSLDSSTAILVPRNTFDSIKARLAVTEPPWVSSRIRCRTNGVFWLPFEPAAVASCKACNMIASILAFGIECSAGIGFANRSPDSIRIFR